MEKVTCELYLEGISGSRKENSWQRAQLERRNGGVKAHVCFRDASSTEWLQHSVYGDGGWGVAGNKAENVGWSLSKRITECHAHNTRLDLLGNETTKALLMVCFSEVESGHDSICASKNKNCPGSNTKVI